MLSLAATDTKGVSETQNRQIGAGGIRISRVRFDTHAVVLKHRLRVTVTTTDRLGRSVSGARITASATKRGFLSRRPETALSGRHGAVTFTLRLRSTALSRRLVLLIVARTPSARARRTTAVRLPPWHR